METNELRNNEVRIGNYVIINGKITELSLRDLIGQNDGYWILEPISLTEEILLKAGFKKYYDGFDKIYNDEYYFINNGLVIQFNDDKFEIELWINPKSGILIELSYIHQLQNLYFALTDKELEINL